MAAEIVDIEYAVLHNILLIGDMTPALEQKLLPEDFKDPVARATYEGLKNYFEGAQTRHQVPSLAVVTQAVPTIANYRPTTTDPSRAATDLGFYAAALKDRSVRHRALPAIQQTLAAFTNNSYSTITILQHLQDLSANLQSELSLDTSVSDVLGHENLAALADYYQKAKLSQQSGNSCVGIEYPFPSMNAEYLGIEKGELISIYGAPKSGKTWTALMIAMHAFLKRERVLVYSKEMSLLDMLKRMAAILAKVDYERFRKGTLTPEQEQRMFQTLEGLGRMQSQITPSESHLLPPVLNILADKNGADGSLDECLRAAEKCKCSLLFIDAAYNFPDPKSRNRDTMDWKFLSAQLQKVKRWLVSTGVAGVITWQANRQIEKLSGRKGNRSKKEDASASLAEQKENFDHDSTEDVGMAQGLAQSCDVLIRVNRQTDDLGEHIMELTFPASRKTSNMRKLVYRGSCEDPVELTSIRLGQEKSVSPTIVPIAPGSTAVPQYGNYVNPLLVRPQQTPMQKIQGGALPTLSI